MVPFIGRRVGATDPPDPFVRDVAGLTTWQYTGRHCRRMLVRRQSPVTAAAPRGTFESDRPGSAAGAAADGGSAAKTLTALRLLCGGVSTGPPVKRMPFPVLSALRRLFVRGCCE